ncbi:hypothetical protein FA15DRAFT_702713 [Coprinopsis marcescibilis]|uniref:Uncharacterized protein n=1 Tax=Coprinopsis marcescibilis TaxID=230819 RepID=A0A5C3L104_COPMA|nr:hypothetical protein FA15DRAFT_702713 [Coprinopsis marcescibilis]
MNSPPESPEQARSGKGKKGAKARTRADRSFRPEEERFNVGPKTTRSLTATRSGNRKQTRPQAGRADRPYMNDMNDEVPNYPPPSFQEAIATPLSVCSSMVALVPTPMNSLPPLTIPTNATYGSNPSAASNTETGPSSANSDDSLQIIDEDDMVPPGVDPKLVRSVREDWRTRRGIEFPSPVDGHILDASPGSHPQRQRPVLDLAAILDGPDNPPRSPSITSPSRRFLSLSPLRTIFPSRFQSPTDRPHSAHPSPGVSPYAQSNRNASFFRSTTSLATTSFLKLPLPATAHRSESFIARKLFSGRGKDKSRERQPLPEALDSWEELSADEFDGADQPHPPSLMALVAGVNKSPPIAMSTSPTRSLSFTYGTPPSETRPIHIPSIEPAAIPGQVQNSVQELPQEPIDALQNGQQPKEQYPIHPLSRLDRKVPFKRQGPKPPKTPRPPPVLVPQPGPLLTTVRTRMSPSPTPLQPTASPKPNVSVPRPSPLGLESFSLQQHASPPPSELLKLPEVSQAQTIQDSSKEPARLVTPGLLPTIRAPIPRHPTQPLPTSGVSTCRCGSPNGSILAGSRTPSPSLDEPITPTRHHYPGRPLPRTPAPTTRPHIDSTFAPNEEFAETSVELLCPEGLLIDLGDTVTDGQEATTLLAELDNPRSHSPAPLIDLDSSSEDIPTLLVSPGKGGLPVLTEEMPHQLQTVAYSEITDLDLLVSALEDDDGRSNTNYDVSSIAEGKDASDFSALNGVKHEGSPGNHGIHRPSSPSKVIWDLATTEHQQRRAAFDQQIMRQFQYFGSGTC